MVASRSRSKTQSRVPHRRKGSISGPIIYGSASVVLTGGLLVGWIYVIVKNYELTEQWIGGNALLLVAGILSLIAIMTVLILFSVLLARQILENRRQTTFVDSVTHELRSPLASIRLGLETLGRQGLSAAHEDRLRAMMLDDVERLSSFIEDILEVTRVEHGAIGQAIGSVDLLELTHRCVLAITRRYGVPVEEIVVDIPPDIRLATDATALEVILKNLLDNAVKYSARPIEVLVRSHRTPLGTTRIEVIDRGIGIPRGKLKRIFDRFYRVDEESVRARRGTGLGLYVARALIRGLHGQLTAHSEGPGRGTTMLLVLPPSTAAPTRSTTGPSALV